MGDFDIGIKTDEIFEKLIRDIKHGQAEVEEKREFDDYFDNYIKDAVSSCDKGRVIFQNPCDSCRRKQIITERFDTICYKEYIPPYVDEVCRDYKLALIIQKIQPEILLNIFMFVIMKINIKDILDKIDDVEWKRDAEEILTKKSYNDFVHENFGLVDKNIMIDMLFNVNFIYFNAAYKRNLKKDECLNMVKFFFIATLRERVKEDLYKIAKLIELDLEYKIAVIEGEIRYIIKCILQEIVICPFPNANFNITHFNKIGSLTDILRLMNGFEGGKHDQRSDFRKIRDTIFKYQKVVDTSLELLNRKIKEYECLIGERRFIVGITGICERKNVVEVFENGKPSLIVPPVPVVILNHPIRKEE